MEMKKFWQKKITFIWQKIDIYFGMVQFGTTVPKKKGLLMRLKAKELNATI